MIQGRQPAGGSPTADTDCDNTSAAAPSTGGTSAVASRSAEGLAQAANKAAAASKTVENRKQGGTDTDIGKRAPALGKTAMRPFYRAYRPGKRCIPVENPRETPFLLEFCCDF